MISVEGKGENFEDTKEDKLAKGRDVKRKLK